jgi:beta-glucosidase
VGQLPNYYNILPSGRGRRLFGSSPELLYPFGFGLSYTSFKLENLHLSAAEMSADDTVYASVTVANTGTRDGDEVVQMYLHKKYCSLVQPRLELKGFKRVAVAAGESVEVKIPINRSSLEIWKNGGWAVESGEYEIMLGTDSEHLKTVILDVK